MNNGHPRVSIGLPVYNGQKYVAESIESILAQTFKDFELIISDNGSTDRSEQICQSYAARDKRIRYYRNDVNRGAAWNHNHVLELSSGEYFKWQNHDDVCHPCFLEKCVAVMDREPDVVLCSCRVIRIDERGNAVAPGTHGWDPFWSSPVAGSGKPHERFRSLIMRRNGCEEIYGLMRAEAARKTRPIGAYTQSDDNFLAELILQGHFYEVPEPLFYYRLHDTQSTLSYTDRLERMIWFDPANAGRLTIPYARQFWEYLSLIHRAPISWWERLRCYGHVGSAAWRFRAWLKKDLSSIFKRHTVPFFKRRAPWTRPIWHVVHKVIKVG